MRHYVYDTKVFIGATISCDYLCLLLKVVDAALDIRYILWVVRYGASGIRSAGRLTNWLRRYGRLGVFCFHRGIGYCG